MYSSLYTFTKVSVSVRSPIRILLKEIRLRDRSRLMYNCTQLSGVKDRVRQIWPSRNDRHITFQKGEDFLKVHRGSSVSFLSPRKERGDFSIGSSDSDRKQLVNHIRSVTRFEKRVLWSKWRVFGNSTFMIGMKCLFFYLHRLRCFETSPLNSWISIRTDWGFEYEKGRDGA